MACTVNKSVMMEAIDDSSGCGCFWDDGCHLGIESLDNLDLAPHGWKRWVRVRHKQYGRSIRRSQTGIAITRLDECGQRWGIGADVEIQEIALLAVIGWDWTHGMEWKGTKHGCRAPPDPGLFWYVQLTESVDDGFANELVEFRENRG